jgi:NhaA family Na+:H+ antiporter
MNGNLAEVVTENYSLGVALGLVVGKPLGIFILTFLVVKIGWCQLPSDMNWKSVLGVGFLGGIGFTMSIFITLLAFDNPVIINNTKLIIVLSSLIAGVLGFLFLKITLKQKTDV